MFEKYMSFTFIF